MPLVRDLTGTSGAYRGDVYDHTFTIQDDGVGRDLSDCTVAAQWRPYVRSMDPVDFDTSSSNLAIGVIVIELTGAQTAELITDGYYDVELTYTVDGARETIVAGEFETTGDITRIPEPLEL